MLSIRITLQTGGVVFLLGMVMCMVAGLLAVRRAAVADPASLY
jgi:ABC-type lipoprotein release transport system permease subunit